MTLICEKCHKPVEGCTCFQWTTGLTLDASMITGTPVYRSDQQTLDAIRTIIREELQRQEGFLRAMVQEELEAQHNAYATDELNEMNIRIPPKSSRNVTDRGGAKPELDRDLEEDENPFRKLIEEIFLHPMVSEVHACRECGKPIIHMEHLKLDKAQEIMDRAYALLGIKDTLDEDEEME